MSHTEQEEPILRTSPARVGKMLIITVGVVAVGAAIFFSMWDFWIAEQAPVVAQQQEEEADEQKQVETTGKTIERKLDFVESKDLRTLAFNALPGEEGNNPTINANVGDKVVLTVENMGKSFHAFGITKSEEGNSGIISGTEIKTPSNPMKPGEKNTIEFVPSESGTYYYICTVPGHREQGMVGKIVVEEAAAAAGGGKAAEPTGVSHDFQLDFVESKDLRTLAFNALPGEEGHNPTLKVNSGDEVTVKTENKGKSFHAFAVVKDPENPNSIVWDSAIRTPNNPLKPGESGEVTFTTGAPGEYYYICTVPGHAIQGMQGKFIVE